METRVAAVDCVDQSLLFQAYLSDMAVQYICLTTVLVWLFRHHSKLPEDGLGFSITGVWPKHTGAANLSQYCLLQHWKGPRLAEIPLGEGLDK